MTPNCRQHEDDDHSLEDFFADYEACLLACADETQLRTVWALPYLEADLPVPPIPDEVIDLWR